MSVTAAARSPALLQGVLSACEPCASYLLAHGLLAACSGKTELDPMLLLLNPERLPPRSGRSNSPDLSPTPVEITRPNAMRCLCGGLNEP